MAGGILPLVDTPLLDISDEEGLDPSTDGDAEQDTTDDGRQTPTLDQLRKSGDVNDVGRTPVLGSEDLPVEPGSWPIGYPLQAVPRVAVTYNLNFVYNEENEQWERDTGNRSGGAQLGSPTDLFPQFGDPIEPDTENGAIVFIAVSISSEAGLAGQIDAIIDDPDTSGADRLVTIARITEDIGDFDSEAYTSTLPVPPGGTITLDNVSDPNNNNEINVVRVYPLA